MKRRSASLVVGLGNPLMGDDGFGAAVLERLRQGSGLDPAADMLNAHTDLLGRLDRFAHYDQVVLVDTLVDGERCGEVVVRGEDSFDALSHDSPGSHQISPLMAVGLFRRLYPEAHTRITLVALRTDKITLSQGAIEEAAVDAGAQQVRRLVERCVPVNRI